jgi:anti-sigma28 factor (negative regulator of flagellin synthesis)
MRIAGTETPTVVAPPSSAPLNAGPGRFEAIREMVANGTYEIDLERLADRILEDEAARALLVPRSPR